jgi:hypothetical protein
MSRGYGKLQVALLTILGKHEQSVAPRERRLGLDTPDLAQRYHRRNTRAELVSVRRALQTLAAQGEVSNLGVRYGHRHHWVLQNKRNRK